MAPFPLLNAAPPFRLQAQFRLTARVCSTFIQSNNTISMIPLKILILIAVQYGLLYYGTLMGPDYRLTYLNVHKSLLQTPLLQLVSTPLFLQGFTHLSILWIQMYTVLDFDWLMQKKMQNIFLYIIPKTNQHKNRTK